MSVERSKGRGLRLFVALDPPETLAREVAAWGRLAAGADRRMRAVPARFIHITMVFIGEADEASLAAIGEAVEASAAAVTGLSLAAPVWLPRRRPRALALDVHDNAGNLNACRSRLADALEAAIGHREKRRFRPHLTAVRLSRGVVPGLQRLPTSPASGFEGESLTLYRSLLLPEGAQYEPLVSVKL